uniref:Transposase-associated domain-containing protein n=1 Tax=Ananas comosus var. bracteatus TaxID=296719 RepID=A0A6V7P5N7_ANACO|nr:unnamed protein product [Ananas comosus var. bracteatus]
MAPSKRWMDLVDDRLSEAYEMGVESFLNYAFKRTGKNKEIRCPCVKCGNTYSGTRELVESHLKVYGIVQNYTFWYHHGERSSEPQSESDGDNGEEIEEDESGNEMHEIIRNLYPEFSDVGRDFENSNSMRNDEIEEEPNDEAKKFYRWSNASFTMLLQLLKDDLLPSETNFPNSYYEAKKIIQDLGLSYKKIDACKNDSMLYWKEDANSNLCKDKIVEVTQAEPSLSNIELVEKCFGPQRHDHVVCYGGGLNSNAMRTNSSKVELQAKLRESQRENQSLRNRMDEMENEVVCSSFGQGIWLADEVQAMKL